LAQSIIHRNTASEKPNNLNVTNRTSKHMIKKKFIKMVLKMLNDPPLPLSSKLTGRQEN
jgi:hypothetical protein